MRMFENLLLAGFVVLAVLIGYAIWHGGYWFPTQTIQAATLNQAASHPAEPVTPPSRAGHMALRKDSAHHSAAHDTQSGTTAAVSTDDLARLSGAADAAAIEALRKKALRSMLPDSDKLLVGTTRIELRQRYGSPAFEVAATHEGSLVERYYYMNSDRGNVVIATLRNGKLVSAQNTQF
jgi:hypothetical protein